MITKRWLQRIRTVYHDYPRQFWVLLAAAFIDRVGGALLFPFFTLYLTSRFGVGMTEVGALFGAYSVGGLLGSTLGGAMTDRVGRKPVLILGLISSALGGLAMGLAQSFGLFFTFAVVAGVLESVAQPARSAMVADLLPEEKRAQGFGMLRVVANLAIVIGPAIGGLLAMRSYLTLFVIDSITSLITAGIVALVLHETKPEAEQGEEAETMSRTLGSYMTVLRDTSYVLFLGARMLLAFVMMQLASSLSVYLRDTHAVSDQGYGYILALNASMVVLFQFPIARRVEAYRPLMVMAAGSVLYAVGYALYGIVSGYAAFMAAMVVVTTGEMLTAPVSLSLAAFFAPQEMRGRYMAVFQYSWMIPSMVGPLISGLIMDNTDQRVLWYVVAMVGSVAACAFALLQRRVTSRRGEPTESP
jgi:MFS family permease